MTSVRWKPPRMDLTNELEWVLLSAFKEGYRCEAFDADPLEVERFAKALDLVPRIAARLGRERLADALGADVAERFVAQSREAAVIGLRVEAVARQIAETAERLGIPVVFLKFAALHVTGVLPAGSRDCSDLDVLVPAARAPELYGALRDGRFDDAGGGGYEHQLAGLVHSSGALVEIHTSLPGVRVAGARSAGVSDFAGGGHLESVPGFPPNVSVPERDVLAAHAIVHGLAQHGSVPRSYPAFRMLGDVADLSPGATRDRWARWIAKDVRAAEVEALLGLVDALRASRIPEGDSSPAVLLRHLIAGVLDDGYAGSLRLGGVLREVTDRGRIASLATQSWTALFPARVQLEQIYGRATTPLGRLAHRLRRPFDVAGSVARHAVLAARRRPGRVTSSRSPGTAL